MECGNLSNCVRCVPFGNFPDSNFLVCKLCALCGQYFLNPIEQNPLRCRKPFCALFVRKPVKFLSMIFNDSGQSDS